MIILMGFKAYDDFDTEYQLTETDALRLAQLVDHPVRPGVAVTAIVTFLHEGLTSENAAENFKRARALCAEQADTLDLFRD